MSIGFYMIHQCKLNCGKTQYFFYLFFMQFTFTWSGSLSYMFENVLCLYLLKYVEDKHYDWFICHLIIKSSLLILMCWGFLSLLNILIVSLLQIRHDRNSYGICCGLNEKKRSFGIWLQKHIQLIPWSFKMSHFWVTWFGINFDKKIEFHSQAKK